MGPLRLATPPGVRQDRLFYHLTRKRVKPLLRGVSPLFISLSETVATS